MDHPVPKHSPEEHARRGRRMVVAVVIGSLVLIALLVMQLWSTLTAPLDVNAKQGAAQQTSAFLEMVSEALGEQPGQRPIKDLATELKEVAEDEIVKQQAANALIDGLSKQVEAAATAEGEAELEGTEAEEEEVAEDPPPAEEGSAPEAEASESWVIESPEEPTEETTP